MIKYITKTFKQDKLRLKELIIKKMNLFVKKTLILTICIFFTFVNSFAIAEENKGVNINLLKSKITGILKTPGISFSDTGVSIISIKTGDVLYESNSNKALLPASNLKLVTSSASLTLLKPEYTFKTMIYSDNKISANKIDGNIYIKGMGDPDFNVKRLWDMVKTIKHKGIKEIAGNVIADDSFFDSLETGNGWKLNGYGSSSYAARISALSLNYNVADVWVSPALNQNEKAIVSVEPESDFFEIINKTSTGGRYSKLLISRVLNSAGKNIITVSGNIPYGANPELNSVNLDNPSLHTGYVLKNLLEKEGISVKGQVKRGLLASQNVVILAETESKPLSSIVYDFNKHSINIIGEILLKYLGAKFRGVPGTSKKGIDVVKQDFLEKEVKVSTENLNMVDGSGLSPLNRITTNHFVQILKYMYEHFDLQSDFLSSLPVAGADGTLKRRTRNTDGERKIRAKTGFINQASSLSGYVMTKNNQPIVFSILSNNFTNIYSATSAQDNICIYLSGLTL